MANNFDSNFTREVAKVVIAGFETKRVISKNVNTQLLTGRFNPDSGENVDFKRPTDYVTKRTSTGDISGGARSDIITGKATGTVQDYFTIDADFNEADQALKMGTLDRFFDNMTTRMVTDIELDFASHMMTNCALLAGTPGTAATTWDHVANAGAILSSTGVPMDAKWFYTVNPHTQVKLASNQRSLGAGGTAGGLIKSAHEKAMLSENFAGMDIMTSTALASYTNSSVADRAGTLTAAPTPTYLAAKDSMTQTLAVTAMGANAVVSAGEVIQVTGRNRLNLSTRKVILDETGANILWTAVVTADVTLGASGEGNLVCTGPGIFEATGAYNTVDTAIGSGDVITRLGSASDIIQPNLFWHKEAFSMGSVPLQKLFSTDTIATTKDGLQFRVSKYADGDKNKQIVRVDFRPAYATLNPFFAGHGHG